MERTGVAVPGAASGTAAEYVAGASTAVLAAWAGSSRTDTAAMAAEIVAPMPSWWPRPQSSSN